MPAAFFRLKAEATRGLKAEATRENSPLEIAEKAFRNDSRSAQRARRFFVRFSAARPALPVAPADRARQTLPTPETS
jgi:hypothetical protein